MAVLNQAQVLVGHGIDGRCSTSTIMSAFEIRPREEVNKISTRSCGDVRTLCKAGRLKEALHILNQRSTGADSNTYACILHECIKRKSLAEGKQVHTHIVQSGFKHNIFLFNTLVNMYAKCGSVVDARKVFDKMPERDTFTWTIMIGGYAKHGCVREAFKIYEQMQREGVTPNRVTFISLLTACAGLGALDKGKGVHMDIIKGGIVPDIILQNTLVDMYTKCGSIKDARHVFDHMDQRDVVSWSAMIAGYAQHGCGRDAFNLYEQMQRECVAPNRVTFICTLNACASLRALEMGKKVHADIIKDGLAPDIILENTLLDMYAKCGSMRDARQVLDSMSKQDVVSWSVMIAGYAQHGFGREAFKTYERMQLEGVIPDMVTFSCVLNVCASLRSLEEGKEVHADIIKAGIAPDIILETALVDMYAKCGSIKDSRQVFNKLSRRNVASWNAMITGYTQHGCGRESFEIYEQMKQEGVTPDRVTFTSVLNACSIMGSLRKGKQVHAHIINTGIAPDIILENTLADMYAKCGSMTDARQVFDNMAQRDVVSWSMMIAGYAQDGCGREALKLYEQMHQEGVTPDEVAFICVLNACSALGALGKGRDVHSDIINTGSILDINIENALIDMYAKCGNVKDAREVFNKMAERDVVSWSAMIAGYAQNGCGREVLQLFEKMQQDCLKPNGVTYISLLSACSHMGLVDEGHHYFKSMSQEHGLTPTMEHFGCMVDIFGRAGRLDEAEYFINRMPIQPDASVWGALLGACRIYGDVEVAERAAKGLLEWDPQHAGTSMRLSNIYAATGRWHNKAKVREMMKDRGVR